MLFVLETYFKYAEIMSNLIGNPLYYWTQLELKLVFNINKPLNLDTAEEIYNLGEIDIVDEKRNGKLVKVRAGDIINVVNDAMLYMQKKYPYLYLFINSCKVMYTPIYDSDICDTMCVDDKNNLWINLHYV